MSMKIVNSLMKVEYNWPNDIKDIKDQAAALNIDPKAQFEKMLAGWYLNVHNLVHGQSGPSKGSTPRYKL